jgi:PAS domain-containing protein/predicted  nucleic acid-binding Zn-ribbon protein
MATLAAVTNMPALALIGEDGRLERSTEPFRRWYEGKEELCLSSPEVKRVLDGQGNAAVLKLDGIVVDIAAMADRDGGRHVLLTLPTGALPSLGDAGEALLDGALDESPALVWLKDLDGRYVRVNSRFTTLLATSEERLLGRTEAEIPPAETVDGPRAQDREEGVEEPLQLEYMVGPFQGRDPFVVLRFPVGDRQGVPTLVCGVAAPSSEAHVARSEAARLLRVERWSRLDADSVQAELLAEWGLLPDARGRTTSPPAAVAPGPASAEQEAAVAEARAERATAVAERDTALSANEKLTAELEAVQKRVAELDRALQAARADGERGDAEARLAEHAAELDRALVRERERAEELERTLELVRQRLGDDAEAARAEVQRARADADAARTEVQRARADAEAARADLDKARADADAVRTAAAGERESAASARAELEREVKRTRDELAALERQQDADDSGAQLRASEKARVAAEGALADAVAERDAALKARAALTGELEQERKQVSVLRDSAAAAEERLLELAGGMERERVRAAGLEPLQERVKELEGELRSATMRADKAEVEFEVVSGRVEKLEGDLRAALERVEQAEGELRAADGQADRAEVELRGAVARADKAEVEAEQWRSRATHVEGEVERGRTRIEELDGKLEQGRTRIAELEGELKAGEVRIAELEAEAKLGPARIGELEDELKRRQARIAELEVAAKVAPLRIEALEADMKADAARIEALEGEVELGHGRIEKLEGEVKAGQQRVEELEAELELARAKAEEDAAALADAEARIEEAQSRPEPLAEEPAAEPVAEERAAPAATPEPATIAHAAELAPIDASAEEAPARVAGGISWQPTAKRTLSASLARESVWRNVLKETVEVLGSEGGWDTVTAWLPDDSSKLGCAATWTAHRGLDRFEALTWEVSLTRDGSLLDQALQAPHLTWLTDIDAVDDARLQTAAAHGMSSALLLPVRNGATTIGLLELLTHDSIEPDAQIALSLEASALQLGRFGHLLSLGKQS